MKATKTAPEWATNLVIQVCAEYNRKQPKSFQWYRTKSKSTSGRASYDGSRIHISAGTDEWEHKVVLIHELSHHINAKSKRGRGHNKRFWELFWELSELYGSTKLSYKRDVEMAREWRPKTRVKATETYDRLYKKK
jgi:hypothetical protein